ncbi:two-component system, sensor histidine kinase YesM [Anaerobium acetethylicum]|uniref:Two-component system, sensor histidine kinase YesM n=2 Tax=Anaerobium acetethylicum TaxID=1619234 RepID=A0A1D3TTT2_9FIRM|nr:two-component system, sensor histidine kinase YesM [Anaerobium acetethylicum]
MDIVGNMEKILKKLKKMNLVTKITVIIAIVLIIPIFVVCLIYFRAFQDSLISDAASGLEDDLRKMESMMDTNLDTIDAVISELDYRQEFSYFLDDRNVLSKSEQNFYVSSVQEELLNIRYLYPNRFHYIAVYSSNNQIKNSYERQFDLAELKAKPYYDEIESADEKVSYGSVRNSEFKTSNINVSDYNLDTSAILVLPTYMKVYNLSTKEIVGVVEVDTEITKLVGGRTLEGMSGDSSYLLFGQDNSLLYNTKDFENAGFEGIEFEDREGSRNVTIDGKPYMMVYSRCDITGLVRAVVMPEDKVMVFAEDMLFRLIGVAVAGICIVVGIIYWLIRRMLQRLLVLDSKMSEIESGKFDVVIEDEHEDEISRISRSFNRMTSRLESVINAAIKREHAQREAELQALQAQINPHFLYNTLENMRMQCEIDGYFTISDSLAALGDLFRYSIKWGSKEVPFEMEWANLKNYMAIMQMRFDDDVKCILECDEGIDDIIVPKLMLQPLVENSFNHGFKESLPPWVISVRALKREGRLMIEIEDNGAGIEEKRLKKLKACMERNTPFENAEQQRKSIGVINVKQRIDMICRPGSRMEIDSLPGIGTKIVITIVLEEE